MGPSSRTTNAKISRNPLLRYGWRRDGPISWSRLLHYGKAWRSAALCVKEASRTRPVALTTNPAEFTFQCTLG